jgi:DNA-binding MarR family transcriptional regulator
MHQDKLLHQPTRLAVIAHLIRSGGKSPFVDVCRALDIQHPGALSAHNRVLEDAGYLELKKFFVGRKGRTLLVVTPKGRRAFADHRAAVAAITATDPPTMEVTA